jgi:hypothetical protein
MQFGDRNRMDYPTPFNVSLHHVMVVCDGFIPEAGVEQDSERSCHRSGRS